MKPPEFLPGDLVTRRKWAPSIYDGKVGLVIQTALTDPVLWTIAGPRKYYRYLVIWSPSLTIPTQRVGGHRARDLMLVCRHDETT